MAQNKQKNAPTNSTPMIEARIDRLLAGNGKTKAFASATIGGAFAIHGIRIIDTEKGIFIAMPQESYIKNGEKNYKSIFHAVTAEARTALIDAVDIVYAQALEELEDLREPEAQEKAEETEAAEEAPEQGMEMTM